MDTDSKVFVGLVIIVALFFSNLIIWSYAKDMAAIKAGLVQKVEQGTIVWQRP